MTGESKQNGNLLESADNEADLTIITPTYNRCDKIGKLYDSLTRQSCQNFQWLVIDDGSTDGTEDWFLKLIATKDRTSTFLIDYHKKENGGKHTALNASHPYIKGKWMTIVDSDDYLTDDAVETMVHKWEKYETDSTIGGITFQRRLGGEAIDKSIVGETITTFVKKANAGMSGDHCETLRTELFKRIRFPEYQGEKFVGEGAMWYLATRGYKVVYSDKIVYVCEYLQDGLTKSGRAMRIQNPRGGMWHAQAFLGGEFRLKIRLKNALLYDTYLYFAKAAGSGRDDLPCDSVDSWDCKLLLAFMKIPGYALYVFWKKRYA